MGLSELRRYVESVWAMEEIVVSDETVTTIKEIGKDISMREVMKRMTGLSDVDMSRLDRGYKTCEWNPVDGREAQIGDDPGACRRIARVYLGANGAWHLCEKCAALPNFKRFKAREPLMRGQMSRESMSKILADNQ